MNLQTMYIFINGIKQYKHHTNHDANTYGLQAVSGYVKL